MKFYSIWLTALVVMEAPDEQGAREQMTDVMEGVGNRTRDRLVELSMKVKECEEIRPTQ